MREPGLLRSDAGHAEPGTLFIGECDHGDRDDGCDAAGPDEIDRVERRHHAQRPVERTAVGYRVEVRSGDEGTLGVAAPTGGHPPGPHVAVAVLLDSQAATLRFGGEPFAQREIGCRPCESAIAAGGGFAADVEDRLPQRIKVGIEVHY
jgi:hypothetical protein